MENNVIGADHEFHTREFARGWAERFSPTPERLALFNIILSELQESIPQDGRVVELGIGPGYLASHLLEAMQAIEYTGIDFSQPMLEIARSRLVQYASRVTFTQADLVKDDWTSMLAAPINAVISTWTLHDLGSQVNVYSVYAKSARILDTSSVFLNGDFIKPIGAAQEFEAGRFAIARHLELLTSAGFRDAECLALLEEEIETPTAAQNYACFKAVK